VAQQLSIDLVNDPAGLMVVMRGEADIAGAEVMERQLMPVAAQKPRRVIIDLSGVTLISSIAMGVLVHLRHGVRQHGGEVVLAGAGGIVLSALKRAQLDRMFVLLPSAKDALRPA